MPFSSHYQIDLPQCNVLDYLFGGGGNASDKPVWFDSREPNRKNLSPKQLLRWVRRMGAGLHRMGMGKGDVVLICGPNHIFYPVAYLGAVGAGCVFSGANPVYTVRELHHQISNTKAKIVLAHPSMLSRVAEAATQAGVTTDRIFQFSDTECKTQDGIRDWTSILGSDKDGDSWQWPHFTPKEAAETVATINFSSGTTGLPKGVCVSHCNLIANVEQVSFMLYAEKKVPPEQRFQERWIGFLPLYHAYGQLYSVLLTTKHQVPSYIMAQFDFEHFLSVISKHKITSLQVAPPVIVMLTKRPETAKYDLSSVSLVTCGAAPLSRELQNECQRKLSLLINQGWGMTEVTCASLQVPGGVEDNTGSTGKLLPNCKAKLVDDGGREVGVGEAGELYISGPNNCMRYWRNETATRETIDDEGWLKTGDIAKCDDRGFFWIVDRKKELIKVNGLQVPPAELEAALLENEHVADAAVVGITIDESEWPRAYVVLQEASKSKVGPQDIQDWLATRVAKHKKLAGGCVFIEEVPKLASGKIQRKVMREWAKKDAEVIKKGGGSIGRARL